MESPRGNDEDALIRRCRCKRTSSCGSASPSYERVRVRTHPRADAFSCARGLAQTWPRTRVLAQRIYRVDASSGRRTPAQTGPPASASSRRSVLVLYEDTSCVPGNFPEDGSPLASAETHFGATGARCGDGPSRLVSRLGPLILIPRAEAPPSRDERTGAERRKRRRTRRLRGRRSPAIGESPSSRPCDSISRPCRRRAIVRRSAPASGDDRPQRKKLEVAGGVGAGKRTQ